MCCRAGANAPVLSGWAPAVYQGSPGGTREVRMGSGQGIKKNVGRDGAAPEAEDRAGPAVSLGSCWEGESRSMPACRSWPRSKSKGIPQAAASSKKQSNPQRGRIPRSHPRHSALLARGSGSSLLLSAACAKRQASGKPRGTEASRLGSGSWHCARGRWQRLTEKLQGRKGLLPGAAVSHESGPIPAVLLQMSACIPLLFRLFGSPKRYVLVPTLPCILSPSTFPSYVSPVLAA